LRSEEVDFMKIAKQQWFMETKEDGLIEERGLWTTRILRQIGHHARHF